MINICALFFIIDYIFFISGVLSTSFTITIIPALNVCAAEPNEKECRNYEYNGCNHKYMIPFVYRILFTREIGYCHWGGDATRCPNEIYN